MPDSSATNDASYTTRLDIIDLGVNISFQYHRRRLEYWTLLLASGYDHSINFRCAKLDIDVAAADFSYSIDSKHYRGLLLKPEGMEARAAAVLLPDWRGQSALARNHADHLVGIGCTVVIADLYGDGFNPQQPEQVGPMVKHLIDHRNDGVDALAACVDRLRREVHSTTPLLCLGYSAGGMIALDYGRSGAEVAGIILCSALLKTAAEGMGTRLRSPLLILQGTQDQVSPMSTIAALIEEMDRAGNDVRLELYTQTHHAFDNPDAGTDPSARLVYSPKSARRARVAIESFLDEVIEASRMGQ